MSPCTDESLGRLLRPAATTVEHIVSPGRTWGLLKIRSEGSTGIVKVRGYTIGPNSYHFASHVGDSFANMHDHANYEKLYGLGDFMAVMNGVLFRTRHNDFELRMASTTSNDWLATEAIELPHFPVGFTEKSIDDQIMEVREYIRAFKLQDSSIRPYQDFFKPVLCYLEGWWAANVTDIEDGFTSIRHKFGAKSWRDLSDKARADAYLGSDFNLKHDGASLPVTILGVDDATHKPLYAQWNYRVLCQPLKDDLPTAHLKPVEDLAYRQRRKIRAMSLQLYRGSRYIVDANPEDVPQKKMTMDDLVAQVPGLDGIGGKLNEQSFGRENTGNLAYYNRAYPSDKDAMNYYDELRGFSDGNMYVALTTQKRVAPLIVTECSSSGTNCVESRIRASWMFPLEVIYMTPLQRWNPYNVPHSSGDWSTYAGTSTGKTPEKAFLGTHDRNFYRFPSKVFDILRPTDRVTADSHASGRYIKNEKGEVAHMAASGPRAILPYIDGVGETRLRYPVAPLHEEGTGVWEELDGFIDYLSLHFSNLTSSDTPADYS
ncbi:hypothetical protein PoB_001355500 [Plakobranchus ocellatus]|uniref:Uncharacterized protein n=1 Tax=Plakobranchus ocellatus TaxID=259542 RepID=A0AAV3YV36_9GAST|nr:hypothetical protein PoB_001355500 [Plakobranchus ocellatus]